MDEITPTLGKEAIRTFWIVQCPDKAGTTYLVTDMGVFCKKHKLNKSHMLSAARGSRKHHKQYIGQEFNCRSGLIPTAMRAAMYNKYIETAIKI